MYWVDPLGLLGLQPFIAQNGPPKPYYTLDPDDSIEDLLKKQEEVIDDLYGHGLNNDMMDCDLTAADGLNDLTNGRFKPGMEKVMKETEAAVDMSVGSWFGACIGGVAGTCKSIFDTYVNNGKRIGEWLWGD